MSNSFSRRQFLASAGLAALGAASLADRSRAGEVRAPVVRQVRLADGVVIEADGGVCGSFAGSSAQDRQALERHLPAIRKLLVGRNPFDMTLEGETLWEAIFPARAKLYAEGRDPLTGEKIANKPRGDRQTATGRVFMAFSTVDIALWDLRGKLVGKPAYKIIGQADRKQVPVYWRPGEPNKGLDDARRRAREAYDQGFHYQKWYFTRSAADGDAGMKQDVELVRVLREELGPDAKLMFDNHSIRYHADVDYSVRLCKSRSIQAVLDRRADLPRASRRLCEDQRGDRRDDCRGEHWYTRWPVKGFLDRRCVDYVQSDPVWCGGISEWLRICRIVEGYPGVKVVPTSPVHGSLHPTASHRRPDRSVLCWSTTWKADARPSKTR